MPVLEGLQRKIAIVLDEVCGNRGLLKGLPLRPFSLRLVPVVPPRNGNRDGGNLGDPIVPSATVTVDAAIHDGNFAAFLQLPDPRFEIGPSGEEIHLVAVQFAAQTADEAAFLRVSCIGISLHPFGDLTNCRVHPMVDLKRRNTNSCARWAPN